MKGLLLFPGKHLHKYKCSRALVASEPLTCTIYGAKWCTIETGRESSDRCIGVEVVSPSVALPFPSNCPDIKIEDQLILL